ncbi:MAG: tetratricopeptide repeat protein [Candidatus Thorarchaeota archaeon]
MDLLRVSSTEFWGIILGLLDEIVQLLIDGLSKADRRDLKGAEVDLQKAVDLDNAVALSWYNLGVVQAELGEYGAAKDSLTKAIELPDGIAMPEVWINLAFATMFDDGVIDAKRILERGVSHLPDSAEVWHALGVIHSSVDDIKEAEKAFDRAVQINPEYEPAWINLASIYSKTGRETEVGSALDRGYSGRMFTSMKELEQQYQSTKEFLRLGGLSWFVDSMPGSYRESMVAEKHRGALLLTRKYISPLKFNEVEKLAQKTNKPAHWMRVALWAIDRGENSTAESSLQRVLQIDDAYPYAWFHLGNVRIAKTDFQGAFEAFQREVSFRDDNATAWNNIAVLLLGSIIEGETDMQKAIRAARRATELAPELAEAWMNLSLSLRRSGEREESVSALGRALQLKPELQILVNQITGSDSDIPPEILGKAMAAVVERLFHPPEIKELYKEADRLREAGEYKKAAKAYRQVVESRPRFAEAWYNMGISYLNLNRKSDAIDAIREALDIDSMYAKEWNTLGGLLAGESRYDEAIECLKESISKDPEYEKAWNNLGVAYWKSDRYGEAREAYKKLTEIAPGNSEGWYMLGQMALRTSHLDLAESAYKRSVEIDPKFAWAWGGRGEVYLHQGRLDEAEEMMRKAIEIKPNDPDAKRGLQMVLERKKSGHTRPTDPFALFNYGTKKAQKKDFAEALIAMQELRKMIPHHFLWNFGMGMIAIEKEEYDEAIRIFEEIRRGNPTLFQAQLALGETKARAGRWKEGEEHIRKALEMEPDKPTIYESWGSVLTYSPNPADAEKHFRKSIEMDPEFADGWKGLGDLLIKLGREREGQDALEKAYTLKPELKDED